MGNGQGPMHYRITLIIFAWQPWKVKEPVQTRIKLASTICRHVRIVSVRDSKIKLVAADVRRLHSLWGKVRASLRRLLLAFNACAKSIDDPRAASDCTRAAVIP